MKSFSNLQTGGSTVELIQPAVSSSLGPDKNKNSISYFYTLKDFPPEVIPCGIEKMQMISSNGDRCNRMSWVTSALADLMDSMCSVLKPDEVLLKLVPLSLDLTIKKIVSLNTFLNAGLPCITFIFHCILKIGNQFCFHHISVNRIWVVEFWCLHIHVVKCASKIPRD